MADAAQRRMRVWLLTNAPSPYQLEFLRELQQRPATELHTRFMQAEFRGTQPLESVSGLNYRVMLALGVPGKRDELKLHPKALWESAFGRFDCFVLSGLYTSPTFLFSALLIFLRRRPLVLWLERPSEKQGNSSRSLQGFLLKIKVGLRSSVLRALFRMSQRVVCIGSLAAERYQEIGLAPAKTVCIPYCTKTERFAHVPKEEARSERINLGLEHAFVFLYSGQLIERKGVDVLLQIYRKVCENRSGTALLILGDGPLRVRLEEEARTITAGRVLLLGHRAQEELPVIFAMADTFVFPSRHDGWAVVINEACAAGLPILASSETGAAHDLIDQGANGFRISIGCADQWVDRMLWMVDHASELPSFRRRSVELADRCSTRSGAEQMERALLECVD